MSNIKFSYLYRDGANYKNYNSIILANPDDFNLSELEKLIRSKLIDETWFYVNEWKLPDLHFGIWNDEIDHMWHEFESVEYSDELLNVPLDLNSFIEIIKKTDWLVKYLVNSKLNDDTIGKLFGGFERLSQKAKELANEMTIHNTMQKNLNRRDKILSEYNKNHIAIKELLLQRGVVPNSA